MSAPGGEEKPSKASAGKKAVTKMEAGSSGKKGERMLTVLLSTAVLNAAGMRLVICPQFGSTAAEVCSNPACLTDTTPSLWWQRTLVHALTENHPAPTVL
jgi:hypothetical protein